MALRISKRGAQWTRWLLITGLLTFVACGGRTCDSTGIFRSCNESLGCSNPCDDCMDACEVEPPEGPNSSEQAEQQCKAACRREGGPCQGQ